MLEFSLLTTVKSSLGQCLGNHFQSLCLALIVKLATEPVGERNHSDWLFS